MRRRTAAGRGTSLERLLPLLVVVAGVLLTLATLPQRAHLLAPTPQPSLPESDSVIVSNNVAEQDVIFPPQRDPSLLLQIVSMAVLFVLVAVVIAAVVFVVLRLLRLLPDRAEAYEGELLDAFISAPVALGIEDVVKARQLLAEPAREPSDRIVAAWVSLEQACEKRLGQRPETVTPAQWGQAQLVQAGAAPADVSTLVNLYYRARFRPGAVSAENEVAAARQALDDIEMGLRL